MEATFTIEPAILLETIDGAIIWLHKNTAVRVTLIVFFHFPKLVSKNPSPNETAKKYPGGQPNAKVAAQS